MRNTNRAKTLAGSQLFGNSSKAALPRFIYVFADQWPPRELETEFSRHLGGSLHNRFQKRSARRPKLVLLAGRPTKASHVELGRKSLGRPGLNGAVNSLPTYMSNCFTNQLMCIYIYIV